MKLKDWAEKNSVTYRTGYNHYRRGLINGAYQLPTGTIVVPNVDPETVIAKEHNVVYARVSSSENRGNLDSQAERVAQFCNANGWVVHEIVKECASGLNDRRPKLQKIFTDKVATRIIVEHRDRLTRFGLNYIKTLFSGEIIVINDAEDSKADLMQDFVSLITSFCARLYGIRRSKRRTEQIIEELKSND